MKGDIFFADSNLNGRVALSTNVSVCRAIALDFSSIMSSFFPFDSTILASDFTAPMMAFIVVFSVFGVDLDVLKSISSELSIKH